jgi:hypothetical protein
MSMTVTVLATNPFRRRRQPYPFSLLPLSQPHPWAPAVLVDEFDTGGRPSFRTRDLTPRRRQRRE